MNSNPEERMYMDPEERRRSSSGVGAGYIYQYAAPEQQEDLQDIAEQYDQRSDSSSDKNKFADLDH